MTQEQRISSAFLRESASSACVRSIICLLRLVAPASCAISVWWIYQLLTREIDNITPALGIDATSLESLPYASTPVQHPSIPFPFWLRFYALLEAVFFLFVYLPLRYIYLQRPSCHPEPLPEKELFALLQRLAGHIEDPELYLQRWFLYSPADEIRHENVEEFLAWAFWGCANPRGVPQDQLRNCMEFYQSLLGRRLPPGKGRAKSLRVTLDHIAIVHRPLIWFLIVGVCDYVAAIRFWRRGYQFYREKTSQALLTFPWRVWAINPLASPSPAPNISYWCKPHKSTKNLPILFIHGIGIGLFPYQKFLGQLAHLRDEDGAEIGFICLEFPTISSRLTPTLPYNETLCEQVAAILDKHGWQRIVLVGNSYGTMIGARMLQSPKLAPRIGQMVLVDPVVFLLHLPDIAYNFIARPPSTTMERAMYYFARKDPLVAHTLQRRTFWVETILWKEQLQDKRVTVAIAGNDIIVDAPAVKKYLLGKNKQGEANEWQGNEAWRGQGLEVLWFEDRNHAEMFRRDDDVRLLIKAIHSYTLDSQDGTPVPTGIEKRRRRKDSGNFVYDSLVKRHKLHSVSYKKATEICTS